MSLDDALERLRALDARALALGMPVEDALAELEAAAACIRIWEHDRNRILAYLKEIGHGDISADIKQGKHLVPAKRRRR